METKKWTEAEIALAKAARDPNLTQEEWNRLRWARIEEQAATNDVARRLLATPDEEATMETTPGFIGRATLPGNGTTPSDGRTPEGKDRYERLGRLAEIQSVATDLARLVEELIAEDNSIGRESFVDAFAAMKACLDTHTPLVEEMAREGQR